MMAPSPAGEARPAPGSRGLPLLRHRFEQRWQRRTPMTSAHRPILGSRAPEGRAGALAPVLTRAFAPVRRRRQTVRWTV